jgi:DnaJ-like protein
MPATAGSGAPACWFCGTRIAPERAAAESILRVRSAAEGGPFLTLQCPKCRTRCGALRNRLGAWMLYPLEGASEPSLVDRVIPRTSRRHSERARAWWIAHAADLERFRAARPVRVRRGPPPRTARNAAPARPIRTATAGGPRSVLGVGDAATLGDVRRAWRAAVKRWHPDRIPTNDPTVLAESTRRFQEIRAAYEALVAELSR